MVQHARFDLIRVEKEADDVHADVDFLRLSVARRRQHMKRSNSRRLFLTVAATGMLAMGAGHSALAGYQVSIGSFVEAAGAGASACAYNEDNIRAGGGCQFAPGFTGSVTPLASPPGNAGTATAAIAGISGSGTVPASGSVAADLATASAHLSASSAVGNGTEAGGSSVSESSNFSDTLHYTVGGAGPTTVTPIGFSFSIDGSMHGSGPFAAGGLVGQVDYDSRDARFNIVFDSSTGQAGIGYLDTYPSAAPGTWTHNAALTQFIYADTFDVTGASGSFGISLNSSLLCEYGVVCDYGDTLQVALNAPSDVMLTSDSGVFPTQAPTPTPEPGTVGLLAFGMAGIAFCRRWRLR
jgi:hypothetical protein